MEKRTGADNPKSGRRVRIRNRRERYRNRSGFKARRKADSIYIKKSNERRKKLRYHRKRIPGSDMGHGEIKVSADREKV